MGKKVVLTKKDVDFVDHFIKETDAIFKETNKFTKKQVLMLMNEWKKNSVTQREQQKINKKTSKSPYKDYKKFVSYCLTRNASNYDTMLLITGDKGTGKSSAAIMLVRRWCRLIGIRFNPRRHIAYNNNEMVDKIQKLNKFEPLIADEAIRFASSADWNKRENKDLKMKLGEVRTKHLFYILCFPLKPIKLEKTYLDSYVNYWIDLFDRGLGALFVKSRNPNKDPWDFKSFDKLGEWTEFSTPEEVKSKVSKHPNFWKFIKIPKVPDSIYDSYVKVRESNVYNDEGAKSTITQEELNKSVLILMLKEIITKDGTYSFDRVLKSTETLFDIQITKHQLQSIIKDCEQMVEVKE